MLDYLYFAFNPCCCIGSLLLLLLYLLPALKISPSTAVKICVSPPAQSLHQICCKPEVGLVAHAELRSYVVAKKPWLWILHLK
jgi:hypothetical protein